MLLIVDTIVVVGRVTPLSSLALVEQIVDVGGRYSSPVEAELEDNAPHCYQPHALPYNHLIVNINIILNRLRVGT